MGKDDRLIKIAFFNTKLNVLLCVKLDSSKSKYYVATMFDIKQSKIESYVRSGRLIKVDAKK